MRVLLWHWGRRGGGPKFTLELAQALSERNDVEVHLSLSRQSELFKKTMALQLPACNIDTYDGGLSLLARSLTLPWTYRRLGRYLLDSRIEVLVCTMSHIWNRFFLGLPAQIGVPLVTVAHDASLHPGENNVLSRLLLNREIQAATRVIALSDHVRQRLISTANVLEDKVDVIPHAAFRFGPAVAHIRNLPKTRPVRLLFLGRIMPYKGLELLLDAYARLQREYRVILHIAGEGNMSCYDQHLLAQPGIRVTNRWLRTSEIAAFFTEADVLVAPYTEASQSGVIPSAYAVGLPVVATPVGGLSEQVRNCETGLLAAAVTGAALAQAIGDLLGTPGLYERCSRGALALAESELSWARLAAAVVKTLYLARGHTAVAPRNQPG